jgi:hypothetical protein
MPHPEHGYRPPEEAIKPREKRLDLDAMSAQELEAYQKWREAVPTQIRSLVEARLIGKRARIDKDDLPSVVEFYRELRSLLEEPGEKIDVSDSSTLVQRILTSLQNAKIGDEYVNVIAALSDPTIGFDLKENYVLTKVLPRVAFLRNHDKRLAQKVEHKGGTDVTGEDSQDEYTLHRGPEQERGEGLPEHAVATVSPFFGGLHMDDVSDVYDPKTFTWKKSILRMEAVGEQVLEQTRARTYRSRVTGGQGKVKLPRGWGVDARSLTGVEDARVEVDQDGVVLVRADGDGEFAVRIAPSKDAIGLAPPEGDVPEAPERFPRELLEAAQGIINSDVPEAAKQRRIASLIHKGLEYDMDPKWDAVYKADPTVYFEKIWEHKKAKCDEANTLLVRLMNKLGRHARFIGGHSVRTQSEDGEALLLESNRHAWAYGWDGSQWIRLDATPAGDPNVDQEEQQEDLGEGDYGEQEAQLMTEEELEERLERAQEQEQEKLEREQPELAFAREAQCTSEQAREVLQKIAQLRERYAGVLAQANRQWQRLVRENTRERIVDQGPVQMSQMDEIDPDELVAGYIEVLAGEKDPLIGEREVKEKRKEKWFGGYEVYIACDMSGSMNNTLAGVKKVDTQRDMAFLLVDSVMNAAVAVGKREHKLKAPMPVKVAVAVFGRKTEIVLPLTDHWGPKQQYTLFQALDAGAGGRTPDHKALAMLGEAIAQSTHQEDEQRKKSRPLRKYGWGMRRFVITTADGESDSPSSVEQVNKALQEVGIPVDLFLLTPEDDDYMITAAEQSYQSVVPVPDVRDLAQKGLVRLSERIREAYSQS